MTALGCGHVQRQHGLTVRSVCYEQRQQGFTYTACYCEENVHRLASTLLERGYASSLEQLFAVFISNTNKQMPLWKQRAGLRYEQGSSSGSDPGEDDDMLGCEGGTSDTTAAGSNNRSQSRQPAAAGNDDSDGQEGFVVWDYHVVLLQVPQHQSGQVPGRKAGCAGAAVGALPRASMTSASSATEPEPGPAALGTETGAGAATALAASGGGGFSGGGQGTAALVWDLDTLLPFPCRLEDYARRALKVHVELAPPYRRFYRVVPAGQYLRGFASDRSHMRTPGGGWNSPPPPYPAIVAADGATHNIARFWDMTQDRVALEARRRSGEAAPAAAERAVYVDDAAAAHACGGRQEVTAVASGYGTVRPEALGPAGEEGAAELSASVGPGAGAGTCDSGRREAGVDVDVAGPGGCKGDGALASAAPERYCSALLPGGVVGLSSGAYGAVLSERDFLAAFGVDLDAVAAAASRR